MTLVQAEPDNVNARTVQLVKLLSEVGPDIPEISRRLGQFKESVRYRYKEKILNKGFAVQAVVDHEKLGLKRIIMIVDFANDYAKYAQSILVSMSDLCFLVSFSKTMPLGYYVAHFSVPKESVQSVERFFRTMKEKGMFRRLEILEFDWKRSAPMKAEYYDFDTGRWEFEWGNQAGHDFKSAKYAPSEKTKFDYVDLLVMKELQLDANKSLKEIADKLEINYKKLAWHYTTHVLARKLFLSYSVNWMGTRYDFEIEKVLHRQHRYMAFELVARDVTDFEIITLRQAINGIPFLWAEMVGKNYSAQVILPVDCVVDGLQYLTTTIANFKEKVDIYTIDQTDAVSFTIPYARYDQARKVWTFDENNLIERFEELILEIKKGTS